MTQNHFTPIAANAPATAATFNNPLGELDSTLSTHAHDPAVANSGGQIDHGNLLNRGTNSHAAIDGHLASVANPHQTTLTQAAQAGGQVPDTQVDADTSELAAFPALDATTSTLRDNMNRLRYAWEKLSGSAWSAAGTLARSLRTHAHDPHVDGDGGQVVQRGIEYDSAEAEIAPGTTGNQPSALDNLGHIRYRLRSLENGTGIAANSITSEHIKPGAVGGSDLADDGVIAGKVAPAAIDPESLRQCLAVARSTATQRSLVVDVLPGTYYLSGNTPILFPGAAYDFGALMPDAGTNRIDVLSLDNSGAIVRTAGTAAVSPVAPAYPSTTLPICEVYLRGATTGSAVGIYQSYQDASALDSYLKADARPFLNLGGAGGGGGGGSATPYLARVDVAPVESPDGSRTIFTLPNSDTMVANSSHVAVAASATTAASAYNRVASAPGANQYNEGGAFNSVVLGVAPAAGSVVRLSYFVAQTLPVANMVWHEAPGGSINGTNLAFTTLYPFVSNSLVVFSGASSTAALTRLLPGVHYTENNTFQGFTFTAGNAPATGSVLRVQYGRARLSTNDAWSLQGFVASQTPAANSIPVLDGSAKGPFSITGDAGSVLGKVPSATPGADQLLATDASGDLTPQGKLTLKNLKSIVFNRITGDTGTDPQIYADASVNASKLRVVGGKGGVVVRSNGDAADNLTITDAGVVTTRGNLQVGASGTGQLVAAGASGSAAGLMSAADFTKLSNITGTWTSTKQAKLDGLGSALSIIYGGAEVGLESGVNTWSWVPSAAGSGSLSLSLNPGATYYVVAQWSFTTPTPGARASMRLVNAYTPVFSSPFEAHVQLGASYAPAMVRVEGIVVTHAVNGAYLSMQAIADAVMTTRITHPYTGNANGTYIQAVRIG